VCLDFYEGRCLVNSFVKLGGGGFFMPLKKAYKLNVNQGKGGMDYE